MMRGMSGETEEAADTIAQMRQLAAQDPDAAQRLAAELMAALNRAGVAIEGAPTLGLAVEGAPTLGLAVESVPTAGLAVEGSAAAGAELP
jgi:hypothetical protein